MPRRRLAALAVMGLLSFFLMLIFSDVTAVSYTSLDVTPTCFVHLPVVLNNRLVKILSITRGQYYGDGEYATVHCIGEVINNSSQAIKNIYIEGESVDGFAAYAYADLYKIALGMKSPFAIQFQVESMNFIPAGWVPWSDVHIASHEITQHAPYELSTTNQIDYYTDNGNTYHVEGVITNQFDEDHFFVKALVTIYNADAEVIGRGLSYAAPSTLRPGQNATFHVTIYNWRDTIADYYLLAVGD